MWAATDFEGKTNKSVFKADITSVTDNEYEITLKDINGNILDVYTIDPITGKGTNSADEEVDLPQTGNNSMINWLALIGSLVLIGLGIISVKLSFFTKRKEDEQ